MHGHTFYRNLRAQLTQRFPSGSYAKVEVVYDTPFWRDSGLTGQAFGDQPVGATFDQSPPDGSPCCRVPAANMCWNCESARVPAVCWRRPAPPVETGPRRRSGNPDALVAKARENGRVGW
jgi:hypothetical protein